MTNSDVLDIDYLVSIAKLAALKAGLAILKVYNSEDFGCKLKSDLSPLTHADLAAHNAIHKILQPSKLPILSEEGEDVTYQERKQWTSFWMIDPLDGTKEFIKRNDEFTVNIALIQNGKPVIGVVFVPVTNQLYFAHQSIGAFKTDGLITKQLPFIGATSVHDLRVLSSHSYFNHQTKLFLQKLSRPKLVSMGSSLKFLEIIDNRADVYPRFAPSMEWDSAASHAICNVVGIEVLNIESQQPLEYNKETLYNPFFIVASPLLLDKLSVKYLQKDFF